MSAHVPWQQLIADELATGGVVIVRELVTRRLRREPTRAELTAARRAANRYAAAGHAEIVRVPSRTGGHGNRLLLGLTPVETRTARPAPTARRGRPRSDLTIARGLVRTLHGAG